MCEKVLLAGLLSYWNGGKFADAWRAAFNGRVPKPLEGTARYEAVKTACRLTNSSAAVFAYFEISHCHTPQLTLLGGTLLHAVAVLYMQRQRCNWGADAKWRGMTIAAVMRYVGGLQHAHQHCTLPTQLHFVAPSSRDYTS